MAKGYNHLCTSDTFFPYQLFGRKWGKSNGEARMFQYNLHADSLICTKLLPRGGQRCETVTVIPNPTPSSGTPLKSVEKPPTAIPNQLLHRLSMQQGFPSCGRLRRSIIIKKQEKPGGKVGFQGLGIGIHEDG